MQYLLGNIRQELAQQAGSILGTDSVIVEDANPKFGADLAIPTFAFARSLAKSPNDIAGQLQAELRHELVDKIEGVGGYVNIWLDMTKLAKETIKQANTEGWGQHQSLADQTVIVEHTDPNPFKLMHVGHIYSNTIGEAIARLHEAGGAKVHRVSYHGDVGPHIAKSIYGIRQLLGGRKLEDIPEPDRVEFLGQAYALGSKSYDEDPDAKAEIDSLNKQIYEQSPEIKSIYDTGKAWSFEYFDTIYNRLNTAFEKRYLESETARRGLDLVQEHTGKVYEKSDGAIIFPGEKYGLHTRVFVTSQGLPMYETKDLGLVFAKQEDYPDSTKSIVITGREQEDYFVVMLKSLEQFAPELAAKTEHISHGLVRLPGGKMSSRTGDVITAKRFFDSVSQVLQDRAADSPALEDNLQAAIKYSFLKQNIGANIIFDIEDSVSLEGQTGPYVQYAAVRINSIMNSVPESAAGYENYDWQAERGLLIELLRYPETVQEAVKTLAPHTVAQYLYQLSREINRYYEQVSLKDTENEALRGARRQLLRGVRHTLEHGLSLLNIPIPERM